MLGLAFLVALPVPAEAAAPTLQRDPGPGFWRADRHASANSLRVVLAVHGKVVDAAEVPRALPPSAGAPDLVALGAAARKLGLPVEVRRLSPADLRRELLPLIIHRETAQDTGTYDVLIGRGNGLCFLIRGGTMAFEAVPEEQFRRTWTGYALVPAAAEDRLGWLALACLASAYGAWQAFRISRNQAVARPRSEE